MAHFSFSEFTQLYVLYPQLNLDITNPNYETYANRYDIKSTKGMGCAPQKYYAKYIEYLSPNQKGIKILAQDKVRDEHHDAS